MGLKYLQYSIVWGLGFEGLGFIHVDGSFGCTARWLPFLQLTLQRFVGPIVPKWKVSGPKIVPESAGRSGRARGFSLFVSGLL